MTKTGKPQAIPIIDDVLEALLELLEIQEVVARIRAEDSTPSSQRMVADGRVFLIQENREWWKDALKEAKVSSFRWHDLRHTTASMVESGANLKMVQEALGHATITFPASISTTQWLH